MTNTLRVLQTPILLLLLILLAVVVGTTGGAPTERVATIAIISVIFCVGLSIFVGSSGVMSFGNVAFMAIGAYSMAYLTIPVTLKTSQFSDLPAPLQWLGTIHTGFWPAILISGLVAGLAGLVTSPMVARLSGLQSGIATLALLMVVYNILNSWTAVTRGKSSMFGIPPGTTIWGASVAAAAAIVLAWLYGRSRSGLQLKASREDYWAAQAAGIHVGRHRAIAWVLSAAVCGVSGALYAALLTTYNVSGFFLSATFGFVVMVVLGGYLSLSGAVIGALGVSVLQELLRRFQDGSLTGSAPPAGTADLILAAVLLLVLIRAPFGLMGTRELAVLPKRRRVHRHTERPAT